MKKQKIWSSCFTNHANSEKERSKVEMSITEKGKENPYYEHIKHKSIFVCYS